jgi:hypothetical protein
MNDLHVECYDAKEVVDKKQSIKSRLASGVIIITMGLSSFACGGAGSWYNSCTVEECECIICECIVCECTKDESAEDE